MYDATTTPGGTDAATVIGALCDGIEVMGHAVIALARTLPMPEESRERLLGLLRHDDTERLFLLCEEARVFTGRPRPADVEAQLGAIMASTEPPAPAPRKVCHLRLVPPPAPEPGPSAG